MELMGKFDRSVSMLAWGYNEEELVKSFLDRAFALIREVAMRQIGERPFAGRSSRHLQPFARPARS